MADITKCSGEGCPFKENCYRYTAPEGYWQSYFMKTPYSDIMNACMHLWPIKEESKE